MRARLLAFAVAVLMVVAAIVIRGRIDKHHEDSAHPLRLVCSDELQAACEALPATIQITYQSAAETANALSSTTPPDIDGWLTTGPWPDIVQERRQRNGQPVLPDQSQPLARSPIVVVAFPDRAAVIKKACPDIALKCVVDIAGRGDWTKVGGQAAWNPPKVGLAPPNFEASGLAVLGAATANLFASANLSSTDLDDPNFGTWLKGLVGASRGDQLGQMVGGGGSAVADLAMTLEALAKPLVGAAAPERRPVLLYPSTVTSADVVLGTFDTARSRRLADIVESSSVLRNAGWNPPSSSPSGLPPAGFLDALRAAWGEASR